MKFESPTVPGVACGCLVVPVNRAVANRWYGGLCGFAALRTALLHNGNGEWRWQRLVRRQLMRGGEGLNGATVMEDDIRVIEC